jgi:hypothetical protein
MATPVHMKFTFRGVFTGTPEEWSFGCRFSRDNPLGDDANITNIDQGAVSDAIGALIGQSGAGQFSNNVRVTDWRAYEIGPAGVMENNPLVVDVTAMNLAGTTANRYPPQIALVVTNVAANRGPGRFGRMYLPGPASALGSDMRLSVEDATAYATKATAFLKSVSDAIDLEGLASSEGLNISESPFLTGSRQAIDHVEVGRTLDTLRSRRRSLLEDRYEHTHIDW